jgi:hypothetical protein
MAETFEIFAAAKSDLERYFETCKGALRKDYDGLFALGLSDDDFKMLWPNGRCAEPDFDLAERYGASVHDLVYQACMDCASMKRAFAELEFRARPN